MRISIQKFMIALVSFFVKPEKNSIFLKNGKMVISVEKLEFF